MPRNNTTGYDYVTLHPRWKGKPVQARFHKRGFSKVWMQHQPGEPGFAGEHHALMAGAANKTLAAPVRRPLKGHIDEHYGSVGQLARDYFASPKFQQLSLRDQRDRRRYIEQCLQVRIAGEREGHPVGHWAVENLSVRRMILVRDHAPEPVRPLSNSGKAAYLDNHVWAMRTMFNWAMRNGWQSDPDDEATAIKLNPAAHIEKLRTESDGWHVWTTEEVRQFLDRHRIGSMAHLAIMLLLHTVVRRSDVVRLGDPMMKSDGRLHFTETKGREKKPKDRAIRLRQAVLLAIAATPGATSSPTYLTTVTGKAFSKDAFSHTFKKWCVEAGLPHCSPHGVRKHVATEAGNKGKGDLVIAELLGHTGTKNVGKYTKKVNKVGLFELGMDAVFGAAD
jgi:integrase